MVRPLPPVAPVPRLWPESTIVCLGTGPSLTQADVDLCRGRAHVIAVNDAYTLAPWADVLYAADYKWWRAHDGVPQFQGRKFSIMPYGHESPQQEYADIHILRNTGVRGLEQQPNALRTGLNSGYQAINLAFHLGAKRIVLLGYDMGVGADGRRHFFGDHPAGKGLQLTSRFQEFLANFPTLVEPLDAAGVTVWNATRTTALLVFPRVTIAQALEASLAVSA